MTVIKCTVIVLACMFVCVCAHEHFRPRFLKAVLVDLRLIS